MEYAYEFTDSGPFDVVVTTSGKASGAEIEAGRRRILADPRFRPGMNILVDNSQLDSAGATSDEVRAVAASLERDRAASGFGHLAVVAPNSLGYGLSRMWESLAGEDVQAVVAVVRSRDEAVAWLESRRTS